ncbi:hypothetical protein [Ferrovibrio sp.]|uniref:hypothetical protein n=1 Tax=Ferrovibrio sp. TaxID=1917215 RepID=UPI003D29B949
MRQPAPDVNDPRIQLLDSITEITPEDRGRVIVAASHAGVSAVRYAFNDQPLACFFNDAGVGKDAAGISGLAPLADHGIIAATYRHDSARIGDALDGWQHGILSHVNARAAARGLKPGMSVQEAAQLLLPR